MVLAEDIQWVCLGSIVDLFMLCPWLLGYPKLGCVWNKAIGSPWWAKKMLRMMELLTKNVINIETIVEADVATMQRNQFQDLGFVDTLEVVLCEGLQMVRRVYFIVTALLQDDANFPQGGSGTDSETVDQLSFIVLKHGEFGLR
ncbi:hypothetical protein Tco_0837593 [Tanacetum coccineum]